MAKISLVRIIKTREYYPINSLFLRADNNSFMTW
jgi:hypothetical protein